MRVFGLDPAEVRGAMASVTPHERLPDEPDTTADGIADRFARAVWTGIAEPGDSAAGFLVSVLGASVALNALIERWSPGRIAATVRTAESDIDGSVDVVEHMRSALDRWTPRLDSAAALGSVRLAAHVKATLLVPDDGVWPVRMNDLGLHSPLALWVRGDPSRLADTACSISLVGARAATGYGEHVTVEAGSALVERGFAIVSGAAYGIDGAAHRAALASHGTTIAVLAGGVDRPYPSGHDALIGRIVDTGAVLSEVPCGGSPTKWRFLQRNRIIAALSQATVVLEAGWRSGSLNTAGHAAALGRPLGAVPGPVTSAASAGCHRLIREYGATCVTSAEEMAELAESSEPGGSEAPGDRRDGAEGRTSDEVRVLDALSTRSGRGVTDIARRSGLPLDVVQSVLGVLELDGAVDEREQGWVYRARRISAR